MKLHPLLLLTSALVSCASLTPSTQEITPQTGLVLTGDLGSHDPGMIKAGSTYCSFSTGIERTTSNPGGVLVHRSSGGMTGSWSTIGEIPVPQWTRDQYQVKNIWAPEVVYNGTDRRYYLYYSASQFGTRNSAIGVASSTNPCSPTSWTDHGAILRSSETTTDFNAIDANVHWDSSVGWYMSWGSFFSGIKIQKMSSMTSLTGSVYTIANRTNVSGNPVEASSIFKKGSYYYLFVSWDLCCKLLDSTYKTAMGRATSITGPYYDRNGVRLDQGGGTLLLADQGNERGQGGGDVYQEGGVDYFLHHYYDTTAGGAPKMALRRLDWTADGWPLENEQKVNVQVGSNYRLINSVNRLCLDVENAGTTAGTNVRQWTCNSNAAQEFKVESVTSGFYRLRSMVGAKDLCLDIENGSSTPGADVRLWTCNGLFSQNWRLDDMGAGYFRLVGQQTGLAMDNAGAGTAPGTDVRTWSVNNHPAQSWRFVFVR
ncbi:family 43 glycosylhydrolase [Deinococcus cellulosilyticus]|uniref:Ricin B lectin domain-containing protein n=1 Tax=Deinococcus cellulosilyticus (strain DSM 18568 / NBRC 106333 / KACC 11606 / 5516J-15) TaxID=1223518 RepID=A0A511MYZ5_DEIC1|nr:family 43 glycosylhydrolase [Deinococcus cellulosilyticus]GEM45528.1 hypothetical protein DC3_11630 [Deinococcus cellulosilyticus NBRC 106333 = KACC 11606]